MPKPPRERAAAPAKFRVSPARLRARTHPCQATPAAAPLAGRWKAVQTLLERLFLACVSFLLCRPGQAKRAERAGARAGGDELRRVETPPPRGGIAEGRLRESPRPAPRPRLPAPGSGGSPGSPGSKEATLDSGLGSHPCLRGSGGSSGFGGPGAARLPESHHLPNSHVSPPSQLGPEAPRGKIRRRKTPNQVQGGVGGDKGMDFPPSVFGNNFQRLQGRGI